VIRVRSMQSRVARSGGPAAVAPIMPPPAEPGGRGGSPDGRYRL